MQSSTGPVALSADHQAFERGMAIAAVRSQRKRATMTIAMLLMMVVILAALRLFPQLLGEGIRAGMLAQTWPLIGLCGVAIAYEYGIRVYLGRKLKSGEALRPSFGYLNVLVELSLPTFALALTTHAQGPLSALASNVLLTYFVFILLSVLNLEFRLCLLAGAVAAIEYALLGLGLTHWAEAVEPVYFAELDLLLSPHQVIVRSLLLFVGGVVAGFVAWQVRFQIAMGRQRLEERNRAISIFGQHVSPEVANMLLHQKVDYGGEDRNVCVMFLDIRDFSKHAAAHSPKEVMDYLNQLFGFMIPTVNRHHGIVNKFLGDGFMAVFGAPADDPDPSLHAVEAAFEIMGALDRMNTSQAIPSTRIGIGLHMGRAVTGNVGSADRKEYTIIGDSVNLASRVEQATKQFSARLLVTESVWAEVARAGRHPGEDLGPVELKGQPKPARLFKLA
jgi:adenylate cyclase